jgi:hypothetical protein
MRAGRTSGDDDQTISRVERSAITGECDDDFAKGLNVRNADETGRARGHAALIVTLMEPTSFEGSA